MNSDKKVKVLVTGATGFLGTQIIRSLQKNPKVEIIVACRTPSNLKIPFSGEIRAGDLLDVEYRESVTKGVDVVCHAGTWGTFWGHKEKEVVNFLNPTLDLLDKARNNKVKRVLLASTVAIAKKSSGEIVGDFSDTQKTGFWPHLDCLIDVDNYMKAQASAQTQFVNMRLGHFIGAEVRLGMVPALIPRLKTFMVPWLAGGKGRLALVSDSDLGDAFALAAVAEGLDPYESFNICGPEFPTAKEVIEFISETASVPKPLFSVPYWAGYGFGFLMESLFPVLPGKAPFLTRSLVHVSEDWFCSTSYAEKKLGYKPSTDWRTSITETIKNLEKEGFPWPALAQQ